MEINPNSSPSSIEASHAPLEPIHVAFTADRELNILSSTLSQFAIMGAIYSYIVFFDAFLSLIGVPQQVFSFILLALIVITASIIFYRFTKHARNWKKARDGLSSDPTRRLRLVGDGLVTDQFLPSIQTDEPIEPFIAFSFLGISHFPDHLHADGTPRNTESNPQSNSQPPHPKPKTLSRFNFYPFPGSVREVGFGPLYTAIMFLSIVCFFGLIYMVHQFLLHSNQFHLMLTMGTAVFLTIIFLAWLTPTYIRVSPRKFEILRFGWVPKGTPAYELWDLSTSNLLVDLRSGNIRLWGEAKPSRRGVLLRSFLILTPRQRLARNLFIAARTRHPHIPLPTDALIG